MNDIQLTSTEPPPPHTYAIIVSGQGGGGGLEIFGKSSRPHSLVLSLLFMPNIRSKSYRQVFYRLALIGVLDSKSSEQSLQSERTKSQMMLMK